MIIPVDQVHAAAASWHRALTRDPLFEDADLYVSELPTWPEVDTNRARNKARSQAQKAVIAAADVSDWAVALGAAGLTPYNAHSWTTPDGDAIAVQLAAAPDVPSALRREITRAVHAAVEDVYARVLGRTPQQ